MSDFVARDLVKEFETPTEPLRILDGVSVELDRGQNLAVVGPSGSGKSTFMHIAGTLDSPTSGSVTLLGTDLSQLPENQLARCNQQSTAYHHQCSQ